MICSQYVACHIPNGLHTKLNSLRCQILIHKKKKILAGRKRLFRDGRQLCILPNVHTKIKPTLHFKHLPHTLARNQSYTYPLEILLPDAFWKSCLSPLINTWWFLTCCWYQCMSDLFLKHFFPLQFSKIPYLFQTPASSAILFLELEKALQNFETFETLWAPCNWTLTVCQLHRVISGLASITGYWRGHYRHLFGSRRNVGAIAKCCVISPL